ncbi:MAG: helix-turn-helix domain-containing protein [Acidimicrobiia bacterium]|nr:helix-turn-helix domain-containing protein [Acidimicrobiia bacterium]
MGSDPTSIWERSGARVRRPAAPVPPPASAAPAPASRRAAAQQSAAPPRISLKEASRRFGVGLAGLRAWCRSGEIDAVIEGGRWMVLPASVAARKRRTGGRGHRVTGPTPDGNAMLVPRDAWDRLLSQLGHLHEAGQQLAEARERAAKAETEASFLRERLAELRQERDGLRHRLDAVPEEVPRRTARHLFRLPFRRPRQDA